MAKDLTELLAEAEADFARLTKVRDKLLAELEEKEAGLVNVEEKLFRYESGMTVHGKKKDVDWYARTTSAGKHLRNTIEDIRRDLTLISRQLEICLSQIEVGKRRLMESATRVRQQDA